MEKNGVHTYKKRSQIKSIWFRFRKNRMAMIGLVIFLVMVAIAVCAPLLADYEEDAITQNLTERLIAPCKEHIFGTDAFGRDQFARIVYGARISLLVGVVIVLISGVLGSIIGATAGYYGGIVDNVIMRIMDVFLAIPQTLMAIAIVAALGGGIANLLLALSISSIPGFSRVVRSAILSVKDQARACATSNWRIITRHILPNAIGPIIVQATLNMASTVLTIASLSFIGLGITPPTPEWGSMLSEAKDQMRYFPYLITIPGIAIIISVMGFNLIGDGLRDALDPRLKN